jgi:chromosome segregation ATPase
MIGTIMYVGLGFLAALVILPLVHARAIRLTARRLEAGLPVSMAEIKADKDQLRAELALSLRGLEGNVRRLRTKTTGQLAELCRRREIIDRLRVELRDRSAAVVALEWRHKALRDRLNATEEELSSSDSALREVQRALADKELQLAWITAHFEELSAITDGRRLRRPNGRSAEMAVPLKTEVDLDTVQTAPPTVAAQCGP